MRLKLTVALLIGTSLALSGCWIEDKSGKLEFPGAPGGEAENSAPTIVGVPPAHILEGESYEFVPSASDAEGDRLEFSISRKPAWASFDRSSGRLWGTPGADDVGNFTNIEISVSDGQATARLDGFDITVNAIALGQATLSWNPPTENADGSTLTDLAGYRIYYGRNRDNLTQVVVLDNPGLTRHVVENLTPARWYFEMTSVNSNGVESGRSDTASKSIS